MKKIRPEQNKNRIREKLKSSKAMTMAEMLITVAIIIILASVAFIALAAHQRSLAQVERDGYAKQIFIAAQNHLTMARGEGYFDYTKNTELSETDIYGYDGTYSSINTQANGGTTTTTTTNSKAYYFLVTDGDLFGDSNDALIDLMLPFASVDENLRLSGTYIIRYEPKTAKVLDVFYTTTSGSPDKFNHTLTVNDFTTVMGLTGDDNKTTRKSMDDTGWILGWYGGDDLETLGTTLEAPTIVVDNGDVLNVSITNNSSAAEVKLILTGVTSGAQKAIQISSAVATSDDRCTEVTQNLEYTYVLDDVTKAERHFTELGQDSDKKFVAGEDIEVKAVAYSSSSLANIAYSEPAVTNSLFESIATLDDASTNSSRAETDRLAFVSSIRHLENLDIAVSNAGLENDTSTTKYTFTNAAQTADLDWEDFKTNTGGTKVYTLEDTSTTVAYYPVSPDAALSYDGMRHSIENVEASVSGAAGLFGTTVSGSIVRNLELINFKVTGTTSAGALIGSAANTSVNNVIAYNEYDSTGSDFYTQAVGMVTPTVTASAGSAGGLIGTISDGGTVKYSGAALVVSGTSAAGGLAGTAAATDSDGGVAITACYSGGHTNDGSYEEVLSGDDIVYNVTATSGTAGGLLGSSGNASVTNSYSTCSVSGSSSAGGLIGTAEGGTVTHCYCTGLVGGVTNNANAFIGGGTDPTISTDSGKTSYYFELINEYEEDGSIKYKTPGSDDSINDSVQAIDLTASDYESFVKGNGTWNTAAPYDSDIVTFYADAYNFKTVTQLESTSDKAPLSSDDLSNSASYFVNTHYGDWPAPEIFIINTSS